MTEPFFIRQSVSLNSEAAQDFLRECAADAMSEGATHCRATEHPTLKGLVVFEAWSERPEDEGPARFQMVEVEDGS